MVGIHIVNDPTIDMQHEVIFAQLSAIRSQLSEKDRSGQILDTLAQLRELLVLHFGAEESVMNEHKRQHGEIICLLESCLSSQRGDAGTPFERALAEFVSALQSHELRNSNIVF